MKQETFVTVLFVQVTQIIDTAEVARKSQFLQEDIFFCFEALIQTTMLLRKQKTMKTVWEKDKSNLTNQDFTKHNTENSLKTKLIVPRN